MASKIKKCLPFTHVYPPRATGRQDRLGFVKFCVRCGKPSLRI